MMEVALVESDRSEEPALYERPIRVSFMIDDLSRAGTESQLLALIRTLDRDKVEPTLVLLNGEGEASRSLEPDNCPVLRLGVKRMIGLKGWNAARRLRKFWREHRPDVAQIYFLDSAYLGVPVAKWAGVRKVVRVRNNLGYWQTRKHRTLSRFLRPMVDVNLTNSESGRTALQTLDRLAPERVQVIENGVDLERFPVPVRTRNSVEPVRIGAVANLRAVKNIDGLVRAAKMVIDRHPKSTFEVAGEGEQRPELERLIRDIGLVDRFILKGAVADVPGFLNGIDIAVLPSHSEGMSNAVLEYMAAGKPVVATEVGANGHVLGYGSAGVLVPPGDDAALAEAICRLIADPKETVRLGRKARLRVEEEYSREAMRRRFEQFFHHLARGADSLD